MKNKRVISSIVITFLLLSLSVQAFGASVGDIDESASYARESIIKLTNEGIIQGDEKGNFNPKDIITRAEMVALIVWVLGINTEIEVEKNTFVDVPLNHWSSKYIEAAYREGIVKGIGSDKFGRDKLTTREEMATMFVRALNIVDEDTTIEYKNINNLSDGENISSWAKREVELTLGTDIMKGISSSEFAPKDYAKREQVAVVVDRFITNKDTISEKITSEYGISKEFSIRFNGDILDLGSNVIIEDENILVSIDFVDKYIFADMYSSYFENNNVIHIEQHLKDDYYQVYLKPGIDKGYKYKNTGIFTETPFENEEKYKDAMINLSTSPRIENGIVYVPLKDILNILDIEYNYNSFSNSITINDERITKYPSLYYTVKKDFYEPYKGELEIEGTLGQKLEDGTEIFTMDYIVSSAINESDGYGRAIYTYNQINEESFMYDLEEIVVGDKYYFRNYEDGKWFEYDRNYALENGDSILLGSLEEKDQAFDVVTSSNFYDQYKKFPITRTGLVDLDGTKATKYLINLNSDEVINLLPEENFEENKELIKSVYKDSIEYTIELYVTEDEMIKQYFNFYGEVSDPQGENKQLITIEMTTNFNKINEDIEVLPPAIEDIIVQ